MYREILVYTSTGDAARRMNEYAADRCGSAEVRCESSAKRGDFHLVTSHERKLEVGMVAEGEELEANVLSQNFARLRTGAYKQAASIEAWSTSRLS